MANRRISQFTELTAPATTDVLPIIDQSGTGTEKNKKITYANLLNKAPNGSESAPSFSFLLDPNSGISGGSDTLTLSTNGSGRLVANASGLITIPGTLAVTGTSTFSDHIDLATGKVLKVNGTEVLSATAYTGNAATSTVLATARTIGGVSFDGSANINLPGVNSAGNQNTTGSAATLTTPRTIGGVSFNGSANINLPGVNTAGNQNTTGSAATLTTARNIAGVAFDGSANISLNNNAITNGASYVTASIINALDASNLSSGTIPDARFPATLPAVSGVNLTSLNASNLTSGTVAAARLSTATTQSSGNNTTKIATTAFVSTAVSNLINGAPAALDTLNELAAAMADDAAFSTTVTNNLATKLNLSGGQLTGNLTFSGSQTVDGRDLSVDGTKLDGIEANAINASNTAITNKLLLAGGTLTGKVIHNYTTSVRVPVGTTAQRDGSPAHGDFRYNSTLNKFEGYANGAWGEIGGGGSGATGTADLLDIAQSSSGSSATFNGSESRFKLVTKGTSNAVTPANAEILRVSINGVMQQPNDGTGQGDMTDGYVVNGTDIIFDAAPPSGATYFIINMGTTIAIGNATTNTIADESSDTTCFPLFATAATGDLGLKSGSNLTFNSANGTLAATIFSGSGASLTNLPAGNLTGTVADARISTLTASKLSGALPAIDGSALTGISAGATGGGSDEVFVETGQTVTTSYTLSTNKNAVTVSPAINSGVTITVPSGATLVIL